MPLVRFFPAAVWAAHQSGTGRIVANHPWRSTSATCFTFSILFSPISRIPAAIAIRNANRDAVLRVSVPEVPCLIPRSHFESSSLTKGLVMSRVVGLCIVIGLSVTAAVPDPVKPDPEMPRPIAAVDTVFIEDLTWMEVRDAMRAGKETVIVATGGVEQNGPYLVTGKHNLILRATTEAIARKLGNALVAPIVPFVPEGDIDPPSLHMKYPGTISVTEETFESLLVDICASFRTHGFKRILLIGDSGGNQTGMQKVTDRLNQKWAGGSTTVHFVPEYYDYAGVTKWLEQQGIREVAEGFHDDFAITAIMMSVDPSSVRSKQRIEARRFRINGVDLAPVEKTIEWGRRIVDFRADATVKAFREKLP